MRWGGFAALGAECLVCLLVECVPHARGQPAVEGAEKLCAVQRRCDAHGASHLPPMVVKAIGDQPAHALAHHKDGLALGAAYFHHLRRHLLHGVFEGYCVDRVAECVDSRIARMLEVQPHRPQG